MCLRSLNPVSHLFRNDRLVLSKYKPILGDKARYILNIQYSVTETILRFLNGYKKIYFLTIKFLRYRVYVGLDLRWDKIIQLPYTEPINAIRDSAQITLWRPGHCQLISPCPYNLSYTLIDRVHQLYTSRISSKITQPVGILSLFTPPL